MTPSSFHLLIKNFTRLDPAEHEVIKSLSTDHPYSQLLHILVARSSKDQGKPDQAAQLNRAAVYSTDRSVIKWAMTTAPRARLQLPDAAPKIKEPIAAAVPKTVAEPVPVKVAVKENLIERSSLEGDALRDDLAVQLNRLQQLKREFQVSYENFKTAIPGFKTAKMESPGEPNPAIIEEIKTTRKKLKIPSPKVAEQGEIIDKFIKGVPPISKPAASTPAADLAEDSVSYSDNVVSETLVDILVKQGKKVKAVEMLKKLIWKYPQKKAYFAAQIEALKD